jgi:protein-disulfide isomerase/uncharacterized membrane protein
MTTPTTDSPPKPKPRRLANTLRILICILAASGWLMSLELTKLSGGVPSSLVWLQQSCGEDPSSGCASVLRSHYGRYQLGPNLAIPAGTLGMAYFSMIFLWQLFVGVPTYARRWWHFPIVLLVLIGAWRSWYYLDVMANILQQWCPGCVVTQVINLTIVLLTLMAYPWRREKPAHPPRPGAGLWFATGALCVSMALLHLFSVMFMVTQSRAHKAELQVKQIVENPQLALWQYNEGPRLNIPDRPDAIRIGPVNAPHKVVIFSDFQCPACRNAHRLIERLHREHPGRFSITYRHLPLNSDCNPGAKSQAHAAACKAALAFEASRLTGDVESTIRLGRLMFGRQEILGSADWTEWAMEAGLDPAEFDQALANPVIEHAIKTDVEVMQAYNLSAPPVIVVNNRVLTYWVSEAAWEQLLGVDESN